MSDSPTPKEKITWGEIQPALSRAGGDTVQEMYGGIMKREFPNASAVDLWGSSIMFNLDANTLILKCAGEEKEVPMPYRSSGGRKEK